MIISPRSIESLNTSSRKALIINWRFRWALVFEARTWLLFQKQIKITFLILKVDEDMTRFPPATLFSSCRVRSSRAIFFIMTSPQTDKRRIHHFEYSSRHLTSVELIRHLQERHLSGITYNFFKIPRFYKFHAWQLFNIVYIFALLKTRVNNNICLWDCRDTHLSLLSILRESIHC